MTALTGGRDFLSVVWVVEVVECVAEFCCPSPHVRKTGFFDPTPMGFARGVTNHVH